MCVCVSGECKSAVPFRNSSGKLTFLMICPTISGMFFWLNCISHAVCRCVYSVHAGRQIYTLGTLSPRHACGLSRGRGMWATWFEYIELQVKHIKFAFRSDAINLVVRILGTIYGICDSGVFIAYLVLYRIIVVNIIEISRSKCSVFNLLSIKT